MRPDIRQETTTNLKRRFFLWSALILLSGGLLLSGLSYWNTRHLLMAEAMPDYVYRRVSLNPHNPQHLADPFEEEMIDWFAEDSSRTFWQGTVRRNGELFLSP